MKMAEVDNRTFENEKWRHEGLRFIVFFFEFW